MANSIKYNTGTEANALSIGNFHMGVGDVSKGPTSTTGYHNGINPPPGGYTIYVHNKNIGPSIQRAFNDAELIRITNTIASASYTTINECFNYFDGQVDKMVVHQPINSIVTDGLILILDANLIPSYPRNGSTWNDLSGQGADAEDVNMPTWDSKGYFTFDGTNDELHSVNLTQEYRDLFFVCRTNKSSGLHMLFGKHNDNDDSLRFEGPYLRTAANIDPNDWQYGAISDVFINGEFDALAGGNYDLSNKLNFVRSYRSNDSGFGTSFRYEISTSFMDRRFTGDLAYILCYNRKLTNAEVLHNYYQGPIVTDGLIFAIDAGNLVSYEDGSTTAYSLTGSVNGTLGGGTYYSPNNGGMFVFDGDNDYLQFATDPVFERGTTPFTMEAWVELLDNTGTSDISAVTGGGNPLCDNCNGGYFLYFMGSSSTILNLRFDDSGLGNMDSISYTRGTSFEDGKFHHLVGLRDGTNTKLYLDGELVKTGTDNAVDVNDIGTFFISGWSNYRGNMNVGISRIYDRALTAEEVMQNYSAGKGRFSA